MCIKTLNTRILSPTGKKTLSLVIKARMKSTNNAKIVYYFIIIVFILIFLRQSYQAVKKFLEMNTSFHVHLKVNLENVISDSA